jgi:parallel beta-helix repeat protein
MDKKNILKKEIVIGLVILFVGTSALPTLGSYDTMKITSSNTCRGNTLYVGGSGPGNFSTIQAAVNAAQNGDTVFVYDDSSPYYGPVVVNKSINLIGEDKNTTIIDSYGVYIPADGVMIRGFTVQNTYAYGISLYGDYVTVTDMILRGHYLEGISVHDTMHTNIVGNIIVNNSYGIYFYYEYSNVTITENVLIGNMVGVSFDYSPVPRDAYIYHNNFINNYFQAVDDYDFQYHHWDNGYPSGGNYWDNYAGLDHFYGPSQNEQGADGIGDTAHPIPYYGRTFDRYPFMTPDRWEETCPVLSFVTLTNENMPGLTTCPAGDGPAYQYMKVTVKNYDGLPLSGVPADAFDVMVASSGAIWYGDLSCRWIPVDAQTNMNGEIRFELVGGTSIIGSISIMAAVRGVQLHDIDMLSCKSLDYDTNGVVNLADFVTFGSDYGTTHWRSDFNWDGRVSLSDFVLFGQHYGHHHS